MSTNLYQLLHNNSNGANIVTTSIRIPQIQRDYAEGRETESVEKKRRNLLSDMLDVVYGHKNSLSLDFVYGINNKTDNAFEPLDGQQRLTTLFLLHWLFGRENDVKDGSNHSLFVYRTRKSSENFCHWLVKQNSKTIIDEWANKVAVANKTNEDNHLKWKTELNAKGEVDKIANRLRYPEVPIPSLFDYFMEMDEFKWDWHIDPNIHSMIVVLETAYELIKEKKCDLQTGIINNSNLDNITFELLDSLNCDGDELFEKMNARGKALSSYDLLKSSLEEEMEMQKFPKADVWRQKIDNKWIDFSWDNSNIPTNPSLEDVKQVETKQERFLVRLIGKSFFKAAPMGDEVLEHIFESSIYKDCDKVPDNYFKYARFERNRQNASFAILNFDDVMSDFDNLLYDEKDSSGNVIAIKDIANYLHNNGLKMHADNSNTLLDDFTADGLNHDTRVIFYAMLAYLKTINATILVSNAVEFANFKDWMRFSRNVFTLANKNARIDKPELVKNAISAIDLWLNEYFSNYHTGNNDNEMLVCIEDYIVNNAAGQEQARLDEESIKAKLRLGKTNVASGTAKQWEIAIIDAEENPYLWGQIIAPLSWSENSGSYDISQFNQYMDKLNALFSANSLNSTNRDITGIKLLQACLCVQDYRFNGNSGWGSLGNLTDDRDVSWKRHLRETNAGVYGSLIKQLLDNWTTDYASCTYDQFLDLFKSDALVHIQKTDWRYYICNMSVSEIKDVFAFVGTSYRYINEDGGHVYLYRSKTLRADAIRYELVTLYLYKKNGILQPGVTVENIDHCLGQNGACLMLKKNSNDVVVRINGSGEYCIEDNNTQTSSLASSIIDLEIELKNKGVINGF
jgi:hypothetical protein